MLTPPPGGSHASTRVADPRGGFPDPDPGPEETSFHQLNLNEDYYNSDDYATHQSSVLSFPRPVPDSGRIDLSTILDSNLLDAITAAGSISFHTVGDTGVSDPALADSQAVVADAMADDVRSGGSGGPAFLFHLGDVVYDFGEAQHYDDQFYTPFRGYDRPIFAIAGNHDGAVEEPGDDAPAVATLEAYRANFCATAAGPSPDAPGAARTTMTQPGVYFTLDAPFVSIIGLYSNVLEQPGVISSQNGHFDLPDDQLTFLATELARLKAAREKLERAIILAVHHPLVSVDTSHGSSPIMANEIDAVCHAAGVWPDVVLSGHAHLYHRLTRSMGPRGIPYVVAGCGGHELHQSRAEVPQAPAQIGNYTLEVDPISELGYVTITVDFASSGNPTVTGTFHSQAAEPTHDSFQLDLRTGAVIRSVR